MSRLLLSSLAAILALFVSAQEQPAPETEAEAKDSVAAIFGYLSYSEVLEGTADYGLALVQIGKIEEQYEAEYRRVEQDFNMKYEEFLEGQSEFPPAILKKRQTELQELMDKNVAFRQEADRLLDSARVEAFKPAHEKARAAIAKVAEAMGLLFVVNTDNDAYPFIDPKRGTDITARVAEALQ